MPVSPTGRLPPFTPGAKSANFGSDGNLIAIQSRMRLHDNEKKFLHQSAGIEPRKFPMFS
jgi:hypothetical protein